MGLRAKNVTNGNVVNAKQRIVNANSYMNAIQKKRPALAGMLIVKVPERAETTQQMQQTNSTPATITTTTGLTTIINSTPVVAPQQKQQQLQLSLILPATTTSTSTTTNDPDIDSETTCITTTTTTTYRSSSTSAIMAAAANYNSMRPQTLNVHHLRETLADHTQLYFRDLLRSWRAKARCCVVPADRTQELFQELNFNPSEKQISEMLQTAKMLACKSSRQPNGLTFGEFCVLAADLKRFRTSKFPTQVPLLRNVTSQQQEQQQQQPDGTDAYRIHNESQAAAAGLALRSTKSLSNFEDCQKRKASSTDSSGSAPVEVFLGGSCNPTTWRADVAIPALQELGISFYNPQVSDWTPDLIELEHRAKEKARVLFFVMDSETRASAGAIEAAHIAGQNCKQLVLVLHPYKPNQKILNEPISRQEYIDLMRNQLILKELVTRRGLPVLDNIPLGLQRTKEILAGIRDPPSNIASILVVVRGAFDRVSPINDAITVEQCQRALSYLGYAHSLIKLDNLIKIITSQRESLQTLNATIKHFNNTNNSTNQQQQQQQPQQQQQHNNINAHNNKSENYSNHKNSSSSNSNNTTTTCDCNTTTTITPTMPAADQTATTSTSTSSSTTTTATVMAPIDFDLFCVVSAYLSVLQQEIHESGCISPIKGINVPPPPIYLTNMQGDEGFATYFASKNISRTSSNASVPGGGIFAADDRQSLNELLSRSRDSGTSSPQPLVVEPTLRNKLGRQQTKILVNVESIETTEITTMQTTHTSTPTTPPTTLFGAQNIDLHMAASDAGAESDSNDSVFSSSSSTNSVNCNYNDAALTFNIDLRDVYLGGSCALRTKWREEVAMPYLKSKHITFHMPALHESIRLTEMPWPITTATTAATATKKGDNEDAITTATTTPLPTVTPTAHTIDARERSFVRTRRKCRSGARVEEEEEITTTTVSEESFSWALSPIRSNLFNPALLDSSRVLLFVITNETRSLAPMTLAAHCIGLMYNVVLAVQMLPEDCIIGNEKLTPAAVKDYNRGRSYLIDLAKRQGVPVFNDLKAALECTVEKIRACNSRNTSKAHHFE